MERRKAPENLRGFLFNTNYGKKNFIRFCTDNYFDFFGKDGFWVHRKGMFAIGESILRK